VIQGKRRIRRILIGVPIILFALGLAIDACSGLPVSRGARSPQPWLAGVLGLGGLYMFGESAAGWVGQGDKVSDPLWMRVFRLLGLLSVWGLFVLAAHYLMMLVTGRS
jgi:hypothetical protein